MPYKIVRTLEKGTYRHWIAPSQWECNNIVKYPKYNASKLVKSESCLPQADWRDIKCQVKRRNIPTYEEAERELQFLLNNTDTDEEIRISGSKSTQKEVNFNMLVEQLCPRQEDPSVYGEHENQPIISIPNNSPVVTINDEVDDNDNNESRQFFITSSSNEIYCLLNEDQEKTVTKNEENSDIRTTLSKISLVLDNQNKMITTILDDQKKIMHKVAGLSVQIDNIKMQLNNFIETPVVSLGMSKTRAENRPFNVAQINSIEELNKMEKLLSDKKAREQLKKTYSIVCSGGKGLNCAYTLVDVIFKRDFLCKCSWSGCSRSDGVKISLKCYKNIVSFFWEMVFYWDSTFTIQQNEDFFKSILKNANKRNNSKLARTSTARKRAKPDPNKTNKDNVDNILNIPKEQEKEQVSDNNNTNKDNVDNILNIPKEQEKEQVSDNNNHENIENEPSSGNTVQDLWSVDNEENIAVAAAAKDIEKESNNNDIIEISKEIEKTAEATGPFSIVNEESLC